MDTARTHHRQNRETQAKINKQNNEQSRQNYSQAKENKPTPETTP